MQTELDAQTAAAACHAAVAAERTRMADEVRLSLFGLSLLGLRALGLSLLGLRALGLSLLGLSLLGR